MRKTIFCIVALLVMSSLAAKGDGLKVRQIGGTVTDTEGNPIKGVVMSDGYSVTVTAEDGTYSMICDPRADYVSYSIPADCEVVLRQGHPIFYQKVLGNKSRYDFTLKKMKKGPEKKFRLFFMADPQVQNEYHLRRFATESVPDIRAYAKGRTPVYGVTLGDIGYTEGDKNTDFLLPLMHNEMSADKVGFPVFNTIGNHDFMFGKIETDAFSPTITLARNRIYEYIFGPLDYSWNRGEVHIISMNDVQFSDKDNPGKYRGGFTEDQLNWLEADLSHVEKDKMIIFCTHIPMEIVVRSHNPEAGRRVLAMLGEFRNCIIMSGHTHTNIRNLLDGRIQEYVAGAVSGCWWWSRNCADGSPNGYMVFTIDGEKITDNVYKAVGRSEKFQIRMYRGDSVFGGTYEEFRMPYSHNTILANVWNYGPGWTVRAYEDGKFTEELQPMPASNDFTPEAGTTKDWWAIGYNIGVVGRGHKKGSTRNNYCSKNHHMFRYEMKDSSAKLKIVAADPYGNTWECSEIIEDADYSSAAPPEYAPSPIW